MIIENIDVIPLDGEYFVYVEAWIDDRIQVSPATWEEPAEFKPGLCHANFVVEVQPPTDPDKLETTDNKVAFSELVAWVREQDIDWIDVDLSEI
jgi:hypothetical protein